MFKYEINDEVLIDFYKDGQLIKSKGKITARFYGDDSKYYQVQTRWFGYFIRSEKNIYSLIDPNFLEFINSISA